ncbi:hypothetical protein GCM10022200_26620 [Microbacterium awajiense]|uniref:HTH luxR-type domain-containing protein n=1 Tax=Microbacterium awajiense TaxID=415214 RepID=A0ABP7AWV5_9MICO
MQNEQSDRVIAALETAREGADVDLLARVVHENLWTLYDRHYEILLQAISELPGRTLERYSVLRALHPMTPALAASSAPFDASSLDDVEASETVRDMIVVLQILTSRWNGDLRGSAEYARVLRARIYDLAVPDRAERGSNLWLLHGAVGSALLLAGDTAGAVRELSTAREVARCSGSTNGERSVLGRQALAEVLRGSVADAQRSLAAARALPPLTAAYAPEAQAETIADLLVSLEAGGIEEPERVQQLLHLEPTAFTWSFVALAKARYFLLSGRPFEAIEAARVAASTHRTQDGTLPADILARVYIESFLMLGRERAAQRAALVVKEPGPLAVTALARLALARGDLDAAARYIRDLSSEAWSSPAREADLVCLRTWEVVARDTVGPESARRFASLVTNPHARRAVLSTPRWVVEAIVAAMPDDQRAIVDAAIEGLTFPELGRSTLNLTASERRVFAALATHARVADLASALFLSPNTVKTHLSSLYRKLGVSSRREAIEMHSVLISDPEAEPQVMVG